MKQGLAKLGSIRKVSFIHCVLAEHLAPLFLSSLPNLDSATFDAFMLRLMDDTPKPIGPLRLKSLSIHFPPLQLPLIFPKDSLQSLELLLISQTNSWQHSGIITFLNQIGHRTRSLSFLPGSIAIAIRPFKTMEDALVKWTETPALTGGLRLTVGHITPLSDLVVPFLTNVESRPVEEIAMGCSFESSNEIGPIDYEGLNEAFAAPSFQALKVAHFIYAGSLSLKQVEERIKEVLPNLPARGITVEVENLKS
ncbi:hypothetical protein EUX98_g9557 [Antrodiella citrinella]|uniref:Uncharacterized protein n=1 Tax=Antrodiella citrinella TaxID=2447956 RepID=A0A4S4LR20_9APHY|nr:hypothetical protein EUX98_g9557 [Antrodiella citrinella]